jgi:release factor glutamine methyltransferase
MAERQFESAKPIDVIPAKAGIHSAVTIGDAMKFAQRQIDLVDARVLLQDTLQINRAYLAAHPEKKLTEEQLNRFDALIARRKNGEPIAYVIGEREFFGLTFKVTTAVLIPRPETEMLVDQALMRLSKHHRARVVDLGTGSGAIAIAIAKHRPQVHITAVDASDDALAIARENARRLLPNRAEPIEFLHSEWFSDVPREPYDLIVSNPPYVAENDPHLTQGDLRFEPQQALAAGPHGLSALEHIARNAASHLVPGGWLLLEHGYDQGAACRALLHNHGFSASQTLQDLAGLDRITLAQRPIGLK